VVIEAIAPQLEQQVELPYQVDVAVMNPDGQSGILRKGFLYANPPEIIEISPTGGNPTKETLVTINGTGFIQGVIVTFGGKPAKVDIDTFSTTEIKVATPKLEQQVQLPYPVDVVVENPDGQSDILREGFLYANPPEIIEISPTGGNPTKETLVTINGTGFIEDTTVTFGSMPAGITSVSKDVIRAVAPKLAQQVELPHAVDVIVENPDGQSDILREGFLYSNAPVITEISPTGGNPKGKILVTIKGRNFIKGTKVTFGGKSAEVNVNNFSTTEIKVTAKLEEQLQLPYAVDVVVENPDGQSDTLIKSFLYSNAPVITEISPIGGNPKGGTLVTIKGKEFTQNPNATFGDTHAWIKSFSTEIITVIVPKLEKQVKLPYAVDVVVENPDGQSDILPKGFFYANAPSITNISPIGGDPDEETPVTIKGTGFIKGATVTFGGKSAKVKILSATEIKVTAPKLEERTTFPYVVDVVVENPDGQNSKRSEGFFYAEIPTITGISPIGGNPKRETLVTIEGLGFIQATVTFVISGRNVPAGLVKAPSTRDVIKAVAPKLEMEIETPYAVDVVVENADGRSDKLSEGFFYANAPEITEISPIGGNPNEETPVTIKGIGFIKGATVTFGGNSAKIKTFSTKEIKVTTSKLEQQVTFPYAVDIVVENPDGQIDLLKEGFLYASAPTIIEISPTGGKSIGGTLVTIRGNNFLKGLTVFLGDQPGGVVSVSETRIEVFTPPLIKKEPSIQYKVDVIVQNPDGQRTECRIGFAYSRDPVIEDISPKSSKPSGGIEITIRGFGFSETVCPQVTIGDKSAELISCSDTEIKVVAPPFNDIKEPIPVNVIVKNSDGQNGQIGKLVGKFFYTESPHIDNIRPSSGTPKGDTEVTISGEWFIDKATITFGGEPANISSLSANEVKVTTPPLTTQKPQTVDVVLINFDGQRDTKVDGFVYTEVPLIDTVSPGNGTPDGGTPVIISGQWFMEKAKVLFGDKEATITQFSNNRIEILTPPVETEQPRQIDVVVSNPDDNIGRKVQGFIYTRAPQINNISPGNGTPGGGKRAIITGEWFIEDVTVTFAGNRAEVVWLSPTNLEVVTPPLAVEHPTQVDVIIADVYKQSDKLINGFTYTEAPHIDSISPIGGTSEGGTQIIISGKWFIDRSIVKIGEAEASEVIVKSDTEIVAITPPGSLGKKGVMVINPSYSQSGMLLGGFEYRNAPVIHSTQPVAGPSAGNTQLTINGSGFVEGATVMIGGKSTLSVTYVSESQLIAITPPSTEGLKNVLVINPDGQQSNPAKFNYVDFPERIEIYNFPNPFPTGQSTTFRYRNGNGKKVEIKIFNLAGELVQSLSANSGSTIIWDGRDLEGDKVPPGLYPYVYLINGKFEQRQLLHVVR